MPLLVSAAALFATGLFLFVPLQVYLGNIREYSIPAGTMVTFLTGWTLVGLIAAVVPGVVVPAPVRRWYCILLLAAGVACYIQSNFLVWNYGLLDGKELRWNENAFKGLIDVLAWLAVFTAAICLRRRILEHGKLVAVALLCMQAVAITLVFSRSEKAPSHHYYSIDDSELVTFSPNRNVILLLLDSFQSNTLSEILEKEPSLREKLRGFVYYPDAVAGFAKTMGSVPNILTGKFYDNSMPFDAYLKESFEDSALPSLMKNGYRVELYPISDKLVPFDRKVFSNLVPKRPVRFAGPEMTGILDISAFRNAPHHVKRWIVGDESWVVTRTRAFASRVLGLENGGRAGNTNEHTGRFFADTRFRDLDFHRALSSVKLSDSEEARFKFVHLGGPHEPFVYGADLVPRRVSHGKDGYAGQARGSVRILEDLLVSLAKLGIDDRSDIIVVSDHGAGEYGIEPPGNRTDADLAPVAVRGSGLPLVMIKRAGDRSDFRVSSSPVALADISSAISSVAGLPGRQGDWTPTSEAPQSRTRRYYHYVFEAWDRRFLPPLEEYEVQGNSWDPSSWKRTGRVMHPRGDADTEAAEPGEVVDQRWEFGIGKTGQTLLQEGWSRPEDGMVWTASREATIRIPVVPSSRAGILEFLATPYLAGKAIEFQPVEVILNGTPAANWIMDQRGRYSVFVPERMAKEPAFTVEFRIPNAASPSEMAGGSLDARTLGFSLESLTHRSLPEFPKDGVLRFTRSGNAHMYHLWGWSEPEEFTTWTNGKSVAILVFGNPDGRPRILTANVSPNLRRGLLAAQRVKIRVAGEEVGSWAISEPSVLAVPFQPSEQGWTVVEFLLPDAAAPIDHPTDPTPDQRVLGLRVDLMTVEDRTVQK